MWLLVSIIIILVVVIIVLSMALWYTIKSSKNQQMKHHPSASIDSTHVTSQKNEPHDDIVTLQEQNKALQENVTSLQIRLKAKIQNDVTNSASVMNVSVDFPLPGDLTVQFNAAIRALVSYAESNHSMIGSVNDNEAVGKTFDMIKSLEEKAMEKLSSIFQNIQHIVSQGDNNELDTTIKGSVIHKLRKDFAEQKIWEHCKDVVVSLTKYQELATRLESCGHIIWAMLLCDPQMMLDWDTTFNETKYKKHKTMKQGDPIPYGHWVCPPIISLDGKVWSKGDVI